MGALHDGHLVLVDQARQRAERVVATIFVNPLQFGPTEDLAWYPRDLERDQRLLAERGADVLYAPAVAEMYPAPPLVTIDPGPMAARLEGAVRPGHFGGVLTVVAKLFHLVAPDLACFGQKDIQQAMLIRRMAADLDWPIEIVVVPTVRDADGLALSSRNRFLSPREREQALVLSRMLRAVESAWLNGQGRGGALLKVGREVLATEPGVHVDYAVVVDPTRLDPLDTVTPGAIVAVAARIGTTRLIDNLILVERAS
jgi:pantoate--beta-alanine ligase